MSRDMGFRFEARPEPLLHRHPPAAPSASEAEPHPASKVGCFLWKQLGGGAAIGIRRTSIAARCCSAIGHHRAGDIRRDVAAGSRCGS
jgi:hypothetical protein